MIRIKKPRIAPKALRERGKVATAKLIEEYRTGNRTFRFNNGIYADQSVKDALIHAQHGKCCFCESKILHISFGHVEHFRPKGSYAQADGDPLIQPGYFWLAYTWSNLFLCCELCNSRHKRNLFPLRDDSQRATSPSHPIKKERPCFLDPSQVDPTSKIGFRGEIAYAIDDDPDAKLTIEALGLNRPKLVEKRRDHLSRLQAIQELISFLQSAGIEAPPPHFMQRLTIEADAQAEFSSMNRCFFESIRTGPVTAIALESVADAEAARPKRRSTR